VQTTYQTRFNLKKKTLHPNGQKRPDVIEKRKKWQEEIAPALDISLTFFFDESSVNCGMTRLYGRALSGQRANDYVTDVRFERTSMMGALGLCGIVAPMTFKGTLNGDVFRVYVKECLAPALRKGDVLVLDNYSVHTMKDILQPLTEKGVNIIFLPPYSPDFSPIELAWSKTKTILRSLKPRTITELYESIAFAFDRLSDSDVLHWFEHCGYSL
jgi:transposase